MSMLRIGSLFQSMMANARVHLDSGRADYCLPAMTPGVPVANGRVGFSDFIHASTGVARQCIEIHSIPLPDACPTQQSAPTGAGLQCNYHGGRRDDPLRATFRYAGTTAVELLTVRHAAGPSAPRVAAWWVTVFDIASTATSSGRYDVRVVLRHYIADLSAFANFAVSTPNAGRDWYRRSRDGTRSEICLTVSSPSVKLILRFVVALGNTPTAANGVVSREAG